MGNVFNISKVKTNQFGRPQTNVTDINMFKDILGNKISDIILFKNGTDELLEQGRIILPRHFYLFEGIKDNETQLKPYEYDPYRIVVRTYKDVIVNIESIG